jgi:hypothetical protein
MEALNLSIGYGHGNLNRVATYLTVLYVALKWDGTINEH